MLKVFFVKKINNQRICEWLIGNNSYENPTAGINLELINNEIYVTGNIVGADDEFLNVNSSNNDNVEFKVLETDFYIVNYDFNGYINRDLVKDDVNDNDFILLKI